MSKQRNAGERRRAKELKRRKRLDARRVGPKYPPTPPAHIEAGQRTRADVHRSVESPSEKPRSLRFSTGEVRDAESESVVEIRLTGEQQPLFVLGRYDASSFGFFRRDRDGLYRPGQPPRDGELGSDTQLMYLGEDHPRVAELTHEHVTWIRGPESDGLGGLDGILEVSGLTDTEYGFVWRPRVRVQVQRDPHERDRYEVIVDNDSGLLDATLDDNGVEIFGGAPEVHAEAIAAFLMLPRTHAQLLAILHGD